ncbi:regulation of enolase protein 1 (concanavalin A-like superfamily) [Hymenobacter sp. UYAg731]
MPTMLHVQGYTDFWRMTHGGFVRDSGYIFYQEQSSDFVAKVKAVGY